MPVRHAIWKVGAVPQALAVGKLVSERALEDMIVAQPRLLSDEWMLIGRQESTEFGGRVDLIAIAPDGGLVLIEIKRDRTPREVVAQAIDYAAWVSKLTSEKIAGMYARFAPGKKLEEEFRKRFGIALDEEELNATHQVVIVAAELDESSERIVAYLNERGVSVNVLCFQVFSHGADQLISRAWLLDPTESQVSATAGAGGDGPSEPWNGEFYACYGHDSSRSWEDAVEFGFISAGGGSWYTRTLKLLSPGDRVWVKVPDEGYVGVARVTGHRQAAKDFKVNTAQGEKPILDVAKKGKYHREQVDDPELCEYFVPVKWIETVPLNKAVQEIGFFGNQNTVCKPTTPKWRSTVDRLKEVFRGWEKA